MMSWRSRTYDELPALAVRREELRRSLRITTIAWLYGVVWMTCTMGSHVNLFARMLGFTNEQFGYLTAIPYIGNLGQLLASIQIERTGLKKYQFLFCGTAHRLLWCAVGLIPLVFVLPSSYAVWAMILILLASAFFNALSTPAWMTWMGDLIPKRVRGRYFANRALYCRPIQILVAIGLGVLLDLVTVHKEGVAPDVAADQPVLLWTICAIFVVAGVFGMIDILVFVRVREVLPTGQGPRPPAVRLDHLGPVPGDLPGKVGYAARATVSFVWQMLLEPLVRDRVFRHYVGYGTTLQFAMALPGFFFWRNGMENLGFSNLAMNVLFLVISPVLGLIGAQIWGRLIDRWGRRPVLFLATCLVTVSSLPWFFAYREMGAPAWVVEAGNWVYDLVAHTWMGRPAEPIFTAQTPANAYFCAILSTLMGGIGWTGIALAQTAVVLGFSDGRGRSKYVAASAVLSSVGGLLGGMAGGFVAHGLEYFAHNAHPLIVGPFAWNNWHATFALSMLFRFLSLLWLIHMPDPGSRHVRDLIRGLGDGLTTTAANWLLAPLRIFGWGRGEDARDRGRDRPTPRGE